MFMQEATELAKAINQPICKLIDVISCGIGTLYEPTYIKKISEARAFEINIISEAQSESSFPIIYNNNGINIDSSDILNIQKRAEYRQKYIETKKQKNIEDVIATAYEYLKDKNEISSQPVNEDWITRFFNIVGEINDNDLKMLWGRILSGEISNPNTYSLRTLETLRNISKDEAMLFNKIISCVVFECPDYCIPRSEEISKSTGIDISKLLLLSEIGLISEKELDLNITLNKLPTYIRINNILVFLSPINDATSVKVGVYKLTKIGEEIYKLITPSIEMSTLKCLLDIIHNQGFHTECHYIICEKPNGELNFSNEIINI